MTIPIKGGLQPWMPDPDTSWTIKTKHGVEVVNVWGLSGVYGIRWHPWGGCSRFNLTLDEVVGCITREIRWRDGKKVRRARARQRVSEDSAPPEGRGS